MVDKNHLAILKKGVDFWNKWRLQNPESSLDLSHLSLNDFIKGAEGKNLRKDMKQDLSGINFSGVNLYGIVADFVFLKRADLSGANLIKASFRHAFLQHANLSGADLREADFYYANLSGANLQSCKLSRARLVDVNLKGTNLKNSNIYGVSAWNVEVNEKTNQKNLVITDPAMTNIDPSITVDDLGVGQFLHLILNNKRIRDVTDSITSKVVLILGRFTLKRKIVLEAIREELYRKGYVPVMFNVERPYSRDLTETITLLARLSRFIIADITEPKSIPKELEAIVPTLAIPVQPILGAGAKSYSMFQDYWKYQWVLKVYRYRSKEDLMKSFSDNILKPVEKKGKELFKKRNEAF